MQGGHATQKEGSTVFHQVSVRSTVWAIAIDRQMCHHQVQLQSSSDANNDQMQSSARRRRRNE